MSISHTYPCIRTCPLQTISLKISPDTSLHEYFNYATIVTDSRKPGCQKDFGKQNGAGINTHIANPP